TQYAIWLILELTGVLTWEPADQGSQEFVDHYRQMFCWPRDYLRDGLTEIAAHCEHKDLGRLSASSDEQLRSDIQAGITEIQEMRPFLINNFRPERTAIELQGGFYLAWDWGTFSGVANVISAPSQRALLEKLAHGQASFVAPISR